MLGESTLSNALSEVEAAIAAENYERAIALTDELLSSYPDAVSVWRARAKALDVSGRPFQASEAYQRVLDIVPVDVNAMSRLALALSAAGKSSEAKWAARQALDYRPDDEALLHIIAMPGSEEAGFMDVGSHLQEALDDVRVGLLDRGIARLNYIATQRPDRADVQVALAHALWQDGSRVAAAEVCQAILDAQPDCLNAHALLLALWKSIGPPGLERAHLRAVERLDPDHSHVKALLGDASPLEVVQVPAVRPAAFQPIGEEDERDRADWVERMVAEASATPRPLERPAPTSLADDLSHSLESDDALIVAEPQDVVEEGADDVVHLDDVAGAEAIAPESLIPLEWEESEESLKASLQEGEAPLAWLPEAFGIDPTGFAPSRPQRPTLDVADGIPAHIEPLEWEVEEGLAGASEQPAETVGPRRPAPPEAAAKLALSAARSSATRVAAAREAISQSRWREAVGLYEKAIVSSRGKALDEIIADLEAVRAAHAGTRAVYELLGMAYTRKGDVNAALDAYHRAIMLAADA